MAYAINGTDFILQPTTGRWIPRSGLGVTGDGHPIYAPTREFEIRWGLLSDDEAQQLVNWFAAMGFTGTCVVSLPKWNGNPYAFYNYSGCVINELELNTFFSEYGTEGLLIVSGIQA